MAYPWPEGQAGTYPEDWNYVGPELARVVLVKVWPPDSEQCPKTATGRHWPTLDGKGRAWCTACGQAIPKALAS